MDAATQEARFFDTRAAYTMFVTTTNEKAVVAARVSDELAALRPAPPGLRILDAGMGDATVLAHVMRRLHSEFTHIPWLIVGKEISIEDVRLALARMPDRFYEHPEMAFVVTNMRFAEAAALRPTAPDARVNWREVALEGSTAYDFDAQIRALYPALAQDWEVRAGRTSGNPVHVRPSVLVIYRRDREFVMRPILPKPTGFDGRYDLILAAQPYRARTPVERKVRIVIAPLARALAPGGRLVAVQSHGDDPGLEIIQEVWPGEDPFQDGRREILAEAARQLADEPGLVFHDTPDEEALFRYDLHAMPSEVAEHIGTSLLLAAWNAAAYVAQIDEDRLTAAMASGAYIDATRAVLQRHGRVWFNDESYVISRHSGGSP